MIKLLFTVVLLSVALARPAAAQTREVTLAWDAVPSSGVAGYIVYVGTAPGTDDRQVNAGPRTTAVVPGLSPGVPYYFSVAAYAADGTVGPRSAPIFYLSGQSPTAVTPAVPPSASPAPASAPPAPPLPADDRAYGYRRAGVEPAIATSAAPITDIASLPDGRVLFIEAQQVVRIAGAGETPNVAFTAAADDELVAVVVDPQFLVSKAVYVGLTSARRDGGRDFSIIRFREMAGTLGEGMALLSGLDASHGSPAFAIDDSGRIFVAPPIGSVYGAAVLRFEADGSVPRDARSGSPARATGLPTPVTLAWNPRSQAMWLSGYGSDGLPLVMAVGTEELLWRSSTSVALADMAVRPTHADAVLVEADGSRVFSVSGLENSVQSLKVPAARIVRHVAVTASGLVLAVLEHTSSTGQRAFEIAALEP